MAPIPSSRRQGAGVHRTDASMPFADAGVPRLRTVLHEHQVLLVYGHHLDDAQLVGLMRALAETADEAAAAASMLYAEAAPRAGSDAVWLRLAGACDLLGAGTKREVEGLELVVYNPFLRRLKAQRNGRSGPMMGET
ncbi:hypothetical protein [Azohydromonas aeria]|uniref:hypothetical protein n=1 Tax=Azohydromonas aeria TaxID=2590212 RepID=UPI0012FCCE7A|nr:hypothetical protein [Azohydromonas aeria]